MNLVDIIDKKYSETSIQNPWDDSEFGNLIKLTIDGRGKVGEEYISSLIHMLGYKIEQDISDSSKHEDGIYDIKANNLRIEIKTAYRDGSNNWQHENLYKNDVCDLYVFLDIDYHNYYLTIFARNDIPFDERDKVLGKKATLRKNKDDGYKFDFSQTTIKKILKAGYGRSFTINDDVNEILSFIDMRINELK